MSLGAASFTVLVKGADFSPPLIQSRRSGPRERWCLRKLQLQTQKREWKVHAKRRAADRPWRKSLRETAARTIGARWQPEGGAIPGFCHSRSADRDVPSESHPARWAREAKARKFQFQDFQRHRPRWREIGDRAGRH